MARRHGRNGRFYVDQPGLGAAASSVTFLAKWTAAFNTQKVDATGMGDQNLVYVAGLPDSKGTYTGFFDDATQQLYTAASDGLARKFYLYPDIQNAPGTYYFGTAFFDFSTSGGVAEAVGISGTWDAAGPVFRVG